MPVEEKFCVHTGRNETNCFRGHLSIESLKQGGMACVPPAHAYCFDRATADRVIAEYGGLLTTVPKFDKHLMTYTWEILSSHK